MSGVSELGRDESDGLCPLKELSSDESISAKSISAKSIESEPTLDSADTYPEGR
jgi:hypothetical protein